MSDNVKPISEAAPLENETPSGASAPVGEVVYKDVFDAKIDLDITNDNDNMIMMVSYLAKTMQDLYSVVYELAGSKEKLEQIIGKSDKGFKTEMNNLVMSIRLLMYGLRGGDNPYAEDWEVYQAKKNAKAKHSVSGKAKE